jgi:transcriptional regulator with XRE-family HTH domain
VSNNDPYELLLYGSYQTPSCKIGSKLFCARWQKRVKVVGFTDAPIPWPYGQGARGGNHSLILSGDLIKAVKRESETAVALNFGTSIHTVFRFRKVLGVTSKVRRRAREHECAEPDPPEALRDTAQFREQFGARLQELRAQAGLTQKQLWERAGLSRVQMEGIESGAKNVTLLAALRLADVLGVSLAALLEPPLCPRPKSRGRPRRLFTPAEDALLGVMPDQDAAFRIGCSTPTAGQRRRELGIPAFGRRRHENA